MPSENKNQCKNRINQTPERIVHCEGRTPAGKAIDIYVCACGRCDMILISHGFLILSPMIDGLCRIYRLTCLHSVVDEIMAELLVVIVMLGVNEAPTR